MEKLLFSEVFKDLRRSGVIIQKNPRVNQFETSPAYSSEEDVDSAKYPERVGDSPSASVQRVPGELSVHARVPPEPRTHDAPQRDIPEPLPPGPPLPRLTELRASRPLRPPGTVPKDDGGTSGSESEGSKRHNNKLPPILSVRNLNRINESRKRPYRARIEPDTAPNTSHLGKHAKTTPDIKQNCKTGKTRQVEIARIEHNTTPNTSQLGKRTQTTPDVGQNGKTGNSRHAETTPMNQNTMATATSMTEQHSQSGKTNIEENDGRDVHQVDVDNSVTHVDAAEPNTSSLQKKKRPRTAEEKQLSGKENHPIQPPCQCKKLCFHKIDAERRNAIHEQYWNMGYNARRAWIYSHIKQSDTKRPRAETKGVYERSGSRFYTLPGRDGTDQFVCKVFFMKTLGYKSDKIITLTLCNTPAEAISPSLDKRGKHDPSHKMPEEHLLCIQQHIQSYNPAISHYRREHAPLRKYLPPELTIREMHKDFTENNPHISACYETYRKVISDMNISFVKLGEEECEVCLINDKHAHDNPNPELCTQCRDWKDHNERAKNTRKAYREDCDKDHVDNEAYFAVDLQKVIMLPRMPGIKTCLFTRRLITFNETFAPVGGCKAGRLDTPIGVIWHEGISGRNAEDVMSAYSNIIHDSTYRDCEHLTFWADNCTAQNKNWTLYTGLVGEVNQPGCLQTITLKYFEKGHTFMAADAFHAQVERGMRAKKNTYDFEDFKDVVKKSGKVSEMEYGDFRLWENGMSTAKYTNKPHLSNVQVVVFRKGSLLMHWKNSINEDEFQSGEFLKKKMAAQLLKGETPSAKTCPRGIPESKKNGIIRNLCPLMPSNRQEFWQDIPVDNESKDLIDNE